MLVQRKALDDSSPHSTMIRCLLHAVSAAYTTVNMYLLTWTGDAKLGGAR